MAGTQEWTEARVPRRFSDLSQPVKVLFASGAAQSVPALTARFAEHARHLPLLVVSEFPPPYGQWIPFHPRRTFGENLAKFRSAMRGRKLELAAVLLEPGVPLLAMRIIPFLHAPFSTLIYNPQLDHYMLRPRSLPGLLRHFVWRTLEGLRWQIHPGGDVYTLLWRLRHPSAFVRPLAWRAARLTGFLHCAKEQRRARVPGTSQLADGISVVIPSRNGKELLARLLPGLQQELDSLRADGHATVPAEIIVVDNGSNDGTAGYLLSRHPAVLLEHSQPPLSFAAACNLGLRRAKFSHVCLLNNDMVLQPGFFAPLRRAFQQVPDLFCATAQIFFPTGQRRQETGKAAMRPPRTGDPADFPVHCLQPLDGEDQSYVLYGSGGCSLYDTIKARALGGLDVAYEPAYVEDLDWGVRAWQHGWPSVFVAAARVVHDHRATTSRYYSSEQIEGMVETNYLRFLTRTIRSPLLFRAFWGEALFRLNLATIAGKPAAASALKKAWSLAIHRPALPLTGRLSDEQIFSLGSGATATFPGRPRRPGKPVVLIASPYAPYPLSHGGAVRMFNLMSRAGPKFDQVLVHFTDALTPPPSELLELFVAIIQVSRVGSHARPLTSRPDTVEEFDLPAFHAVLRQSIRKWHPLLVQLEFTQMAAYQRSCGGTPTILVEHDVTVDLYRQLLSLRDDWELRAQLKRWERFEKEAWQKVDCVVTMSEKDRASVEGARRVRTLNNGVDLARFRPSAIEPEPCRLLFIGSLAHLPNLLAVDFFLSQVWPLLASSTPVLHIIGGSRHRYYYDLHKDRLKMSLDTERVEVEDFVADVRPAYERAAVVIAPLLASAGTNIKIMEAMAMGKAIVSTPGGINGLDLTPGRDLLVESEPAAFAARVKELLASPEKRRGLERQARLTVEERYDWDKIALEQEQLYRELAGTR